MHNEAASGVWWQETLEAGVRLPTCWRVGNTRRPRSMPRSNALYSTLGSAGSVLLHKASAEPALSSAQAVPARQSLQREAG